MADTGHHMDVAGVCPACNNEVLFVGAGGHVTCSWTECPNPCAADDLLHGGERSAGTPPRRLKVRVTSSPILKAVPDRGRDHTYFYGVDVLTNDGHVLGQLVVTKFALDVDADGRLNPVRLHVIDFALSHDGRMPPIGKMPGWPDDPNA